MGDSHSPDQSEQPRKFSRRDFLKIAAATTAVVGAIGAARLTAPYAEQLLDSLEPKVPFVDNDYINLNSTEIHTSFEPKGIGWDPDGHIPYLVFPDGERIAYLSGNASSYRFADTNTQYNPLFEKFWNSDPNDKLKKPEFSFGPDRNVQYRNGYSGITTLFQSDPSSNTVYALTHSEEWRNGNPANFTASVGLLESSDRGKNWKDNGPIIQGQDKLAPGEVVSGAGQPCGVVREVDGKKYLYTYYVDWSSQKNVKAPDQIYLSRMEITNNGIGEIEHLTQDGFKQNIKQGEKKTVITPPDGIKDSSYAALPDISYNTHLNAYLGVIETNVGFCITKSEDGITWASPQLFFEFPQTQAVRKPGNTWYSYPTLLSEPSQKTDQITSKEGYILFSKGTVGQPHQLSSAAFQIK